VSVISALTVSPKGRHLGLYFRCQPNENFDNVAVADFLRHPLKHLTGYVIVIWDNGRCHKATPCALSYGAKSGFGRIWLEALPLYAPELNPDEYLNQDVKANAVGRTRPFDRAELVGNVRAYVRSTQAHPSLVKRYFQADSVRYASV